MEFTIAPRYEIQIFVDLKDINPDYENEIGKGEIPRYNKIIYNENDSKMFYSYFYNDRIK
jgi:hypothetical protein